MPLVLPWIDNGDPIFVAQNADFEINSLTDVTIASKEIQQIKTTDKFEIEAWFTILNNSGATRVYNFLIDLDGAFSIDIATGALATSATLIHPFHIKTSIVINSTSLAYQVIEAVGFTAAGIVSGGNPSMLATMLTTMGWAESVSDLTGNKTLNFLVRSADATATQTLRLHGFTIRILKHE